MGRISGIGHGPLDAGGEFRLSLGVERADGGAGTGAGAGETRETGPQHVGIAEGVDQALLPAGRQAERGDDRLEHGLVADDDRQVPLRKESPEDGERVADGARIGLGLVGVAEILDAGLVELARAVAALAEDGAEIGIALRRAGRRLDVAETDRDGEFRAKAEALAGLAFGHEYAPAQLFAGGVEKRLGRLDHRHAHRLRAERGERGLQVRGEIGEIDQGHLADWRSSCLAMSGVRRKVRPRYSPRHGRKTTAKRKRRSEGGAPQTPTGPSPPQPGR